MADSVSQIMSELDSYYKPQADLVNNQLSQLPAYYQAQTAGLDQAKTNAFSDITAGSNARGVLYSGVPIQEQSRYVGEKYLPALAGLKKDQNDQTTSLQGKLADIKAQQGQQAYTIHQHQVDQEQAAAQAEANRQAQLQAEQIRASATRSSGGRSSGGGGGSAAKPSAQDVINYYISAPSQYGAYNPHSTNLHRWQAAAQDLQSMGYNVAHGSAIDKQLQAAFAPH